MDIEPIYCAEQIVVPPDLADILKAYTKEVIRRHPEDIVKFSAKYFANLASVATGVASAPAPTKEQLRQVYARAGPHNQLTSAQLSALCKQAGIAESVVGKVLEVGGFDDSAASKDKFVLLMLAMSCEDFHRLVLGIFDVFTDTGSLPSSKFVDLISYLGPDMDPDVGPAFLDALRSDLSGQARPEVTYAEVSEASTLRLKLGL